MPLQFGVYGTLQQSFKVFDSLYVYEWDDTEWSFVAPGLTFGVWLGVE